MATRSKAQEIGAIGHKWAMYEIASNRDWVARSLDEDFGIDAEAELSQDGVNGEILKLQFKASESVEIREGKVKFHIESKYIGYARSCRYPEGIGGQTTVS